jgi:hypothetical protein
MHGVPSCVEYLQADFAIFGVNGRGYIPVA